MTRKSEKSPQKKMIVQGEVVNVAAADQTSPAVIDKTVVDSELMPPVLDGHHTPATARRVENFFGSIVEIVESWITRRRSKHTQRAYRQDVVTFLSFMKIDWPREALKLFTITVEDVKRYRDWMEAEGHAPKTMNRRLSSLASLYKYIRESAAELRLPITIPNPAHAQFIGRPSVDPIKETTALSPSRVHQLLNLVEGDHIIACRDRAILKTLLYAGLRIGTLCKLRVSDFTMDDEQSILRINEKGDKRRSLGVHYNAAEAIHEYIEKAGITRGPLFRPVVGSRSKRHLANRYFSTPAMYKLLMGYLEQLPGAIKPAEETGSRRYADCIHSPHTLRATPATLLLSNGVDLRKVQEFLGHRHSTTTQVYDKRRLGTKESASHEVTY